MNVDILKYYGKNRNPAILLTCLIALCLSGSAFGQSFPCDPIWSAPIRLSTDSVVSVSPRVAADKNGINVIWYGIDTLGTISHGGIQFARSSDSGLTFTPQSTLISQETALYPGHIASSSGFVYVTFAGIREGVFGAILLRSADSGKSWEMPRLLLPGAHPRLIVASDTLIYIHFTNPGTRKNGMLKSGNRGISWTTVNPDMPLLNDLCISGGTLHGVGTVTPGSHPEVVYYSSRLPGTLWIGSEIISSEDRTSSSHPKIGVTGETRSIVWNDDGIIIFRRSGGYDEDGYLLWEPQKVVSPGAIAMFPEIAVSGGIISVTWSQLADGKSTLQSTFSGNGGKKFCPVTSPAAGLNAGEPDAVLDGNLLNLVWTEERELGVEIVYRRGTLAEIPLPTEFVLFQNYPNPVTHNTTYIDYELPAPGHVRLTLYNVLGQRIRTLIDEFQEQDRYQFKIGLGDLPSGVYFYGMQVNSYSAAGKLIIRK